MLGPKLPPEGLTIPDLASQGGTKPLLPQGRSTKAALGGETLDQGDLAEQALKPLGPGPGGEQQGKGWQHNQGCNRASRCPQLEGLPSPLGASHGLGDQERRGLAAACRRRRSRHSTVER